jgi:hypothetical protein
VAEARRHVPDDLPYLTDRSDQKQAVLDSLEKALKAPSGRPAIFLIQGAHNQAHQGLVRRLVKFDLPDWLALGLGMRDPSLLEKQVDLPSRDAADFDQSLLRDIGMKLAFCDGIPSWDDLTALLGDRPTPVLFKLTFNSTACSLDGPARLERLWQSWRSCKDLDQAKTPIVCVQVVCEEQPPAPRWKHVLGRGRDTNDALRDFLNRLGAKKYPGVMTVRLNELNNVEKRSVVDWQGEDPVKAVINEAEFNAQIDALFADAHDGHPMGSILPNVREWLRPCARGV